MSRISVACGDCDHKFQAKAELAGKRVKCPQCSTPVRVVAADDDDELPLPKPVRRSAAKSKSKAKPEKSLLSRIITTTVVTLLVIGAIGLRARSRINRIQERNAAQQEDLTGQPLPASVKPNPLERGPYSLESARASARASERASARSAPLHLTQKLSVVTDVEPRLRVSVEFPAEWSQDPAGAFSSGGVPIRFLKIVGGGSQPVQALATLHSRGLPIKPPTEATMIGGYSGSRQVLHPAERTTGNIMPAKWINYLYALPEGSLVLSFGSTDELRERDFAEFELIAASMKVALEEADSSSRTP